MSHHSDIDIDFELNIHDEDEDDWQDAEEQHNSILPNKQIKEQKHTLNEKELRKKIKEIQQNIQITAKEKAQQIQYLMSYGTTKPKPTQPSSATEETAYQKTYHDKKHTILGCSHYQRKCKLEANCCGKIYTCRFCHEENEDHAIIRTETKNMLCMLCSTLQPVGQTCNKCGEQVARYYCDICKLWDDDPVKSIYHCHECGICRKGKGLGQDYIHCKKCNICIAKNMKNHRCIERNLECDCPICGEYMFTSTSNVIFMLCGHSIHHSCYAAYIHTSYQCPTCLKSLCNMSEYFNRLDKDLERQPMPPEYEKYISHIFCNDCEKKSPAKYHFFYHKCAHCRSFNTTVLRTENTEETSVAQADINTTSEEGSSSVNNNNNDNDHGHNHSNGIRSGVPIIAASDTMESNSDRDHIISSYTGSSSRSRNGHGNEDNEQ
ncbi:zinc-ribbon-domain-containing protein [Pilobolus umbonatus]|nr:zinc-ribbon-domain-containing protein [Pilobolus umbonatus]